MRSYISNRVNSDRGRLDSDQILFRDEDVLIVMTKHLSKRNTPEHKRLLQVATAGTCDNWIDVFREIQSKIIKTSKIFETRFSPGDEKIEQAVNVFGIGNMVSCSYKDLILHLGITVKIITRFAYQNPKESTIIVGIDSAMVTVFPNQLDKLRLVVKPTELGFGRNGELIDRYSEVVTPARFWQILKMYRDAQIIDFSGNQKSRVKLAQWIVSGSASVLDKTYDSVSEETRDYVFETIASF